MQWAFMVIFIVLFTSTLVYAQGQGFTVTSVSTSDVITKTTDPVKTYWIINTQLTGGGQAIAGAISPEDIKKFTGGKYTTKQPISIEVTTSNEQVFYDVSNEGVPIYKYEVTTTEGPVSCPLGICYVATDAPACSLSASWDIPVGKSFFNKVKYRFCIEKKQVGIKGVYENPTITFNADLSLKVGDIAKVKRICSGAVSGCDGSSVSFDDVGTAQWSGSLVTGDSAPNQNNFVAIKRLDSNRWQIARRSIFDSYNPVAPIADQKLNSYVNLYAGEQDKTRAEREITDAVTPVNNAADTLLIEDTSFTSSPFTKDSNTGKVTVTLNRKLTSPNIVFKLRADWLGIVIPTGQPKIVSVTADKFGSGETGTVRIQVQNSGEAQGTFSAMLVGCEPFIQSTTAQSARKTILPNDIDEITIPVSGGSLSGDTLKSCAVKVYEVNEPSIETTSSVSLQLEKAKACVPNRVFADGNVIKRCNKDGSAIEIVENCKYGVESDGKGGFVCSVSPEEKAKYECVKDSDCGEFAYCNLDIHACVQKSGCINVINNGDSSKKIDVAFVGDGYTDNEELKRDVIKIVDYESGNGINGLMSVEPFRSNKNKFNIWMVKADNKIPVDSQSQWGGPDRAKSLEIAAECTAADYQVILSKKSFRSYAYFSGDAYLSLGSESESGWGRLLLHEFGHSFGKLADEYVEPQIGDRPKQPNCAPNIATAQQWWSSVNGAGYYEGCSYIETNIRPTFNSIMRAQWILKDDYGEVNKQALLNILNKYG